MYSLLHISYFFPLRSQLKSLFHGKPFQVSSMILSHYNFCNACHYPYKNISPSFAYSLASPMTTEAPRGQCFHCPCFLSRTSDARQVLGKLSLHQALLQPRQPHPAAVPRHYHARLLCLVNNDKPIKAIVLRATVHTNRRMAVTPYNSRHHFHENPQTFKPREPSSLLNSSEGTECPSF